MAIVNQGAAGVRIQLLDQSERNILPAANTTAGVVGSSSRGAFNRILRLTSTAQMDSVVGNGFNNSFFNQGLYAARGVLRNGGVVEFVRPYGEEIDENSATEKELKADAFLVKYVYNTDASPSIANTPKNSLVISHFASTRYEDDGYVDFGNREIYTIDKALTENTNVNFSLSSASTLEDVTNIKEIALFSIINEDPTAADRADDASDDSADKLTLTTATYKTAHTVTDILEFSSVPFSTVRVSTTANIATLAGGAPDTVDVISLVVNDRVLVKNQSTTSQNGVYIVQTVGTGSNGTWVRATDFDSASEFGDDEYVYVSLGSVGANKVWEITVPDPFVLGTDAVTVTEVTTSNFLPIDAQTFTAKSHDNSTITFEFDHNGSVSGSNTKITVNNNPTITMNNIETAIKAAISDVKVTRNGFKLTVERYYGINDDYNPATQNKIFNEETFEEYLNTGFTATRATTADSFLVMNSGFGRNFMSLGLANEAYVKDNVDDSTFTRHFLLTATGKQVAEIYLQVDYIFFGRTFTFAGTIVPFVYQDTNLYIGNAADSVASGFKFLPNESEDLVGSTEDTTFDLAQSRSTSTALTVRVATTADITLSAPQTIDGISAVADDRVLVKAQTADEENGVYVVKAGAWVRAEDADSNVEVVSGIHVFVEEGTVNENTVWELTTLNPINLGTTLLTFTLAVAPLQSTFYKFAFDENDPAIINDAIWTYDPRLNKSSSILANAWLLFLDKDKSDVDMLVAAGTDVSNLGVRGLEQLDFSVIEQLLDICEKRKDCFTLLDGLDESNIDTALAKMVGVTGEGETGRWGSIFDGRSIFFDSTYTKLNVEAVKSIEMAGIIANNRRGGLYWLPPAGKDFGTIPGSFATRQKFVRKYNYAEDPNSDIARLYDSNINPTRVTEAGMVIYGQKTLLRRSTALNRLNVIMLVAGMHKKFVKFLDTKVFNLNTAALRAGIVSTLNSEVERIKNANPSGLFAGTVICDESNNPTEVIDQNKLFVDLIIQPTRAAEFITLRTTVQRTGDELTITNVEIIGG